MNQDQAVFILTGWLVWLVKMFVFQSKIATKNSNDNNHNNGTVTETTIASIKATETTASVTKTATQPQQ